MAKDDRDFVMKGVLGHEGGYSNDAGDPGGPTKYGITQHDYAEFKGRPVTAQEVHDMPLADAMSIYEKKYQPGCRFLDIRRGPDYATLDYGINSGIGRPPRVVQTLLKRPVTGKMDQSTVDAVNAADPAWLVQAICAERLHFMHGIRDGDAWARFGKGWGTRVAEVQANSLHLASDGAFATAPGTTTITASDMGKAIHVPDPAVQKKIITGAGGGVAADTGGGSTGVMTLEHALMVGAAVIVAGVVVWVIYHRSVTKAQNAVILPPGLVPRSF